MAEYRLYFATNRKYQGADRWNPDGYGPRFSDDGVENLRFGVVKVSADEGEVRSYLDAKLKKGGQGDGEGQSRLQAAPTRTFIFQGDRQPCHGCYRESSRPEMPFLQEMASLARDLTGLQDLSGLRLARWPQR